MYLLANDLFHVGLQAPTNTSLLWVEGTVQAEHKITESIPDSIKAVIRSGSLSRESFPADIQFNLKEIIILEITGTNIIRKFEDNAWVPINDFSATLDDTILIITSENGVEIVDNSLVFDKSCNATVENNTLVL